MESPPCQALNEEPSDFMVRSFLSHFDSNKVRDFTPSSQNLPSFSSAYQVHDSVF